MTDSTSDRSPVEILAEEYLERRRRGEQPELSEYTERYPEHAEAICELFPLLSTLEDAAATTAGESAVGTISPSVPRERIGDYRIIREIGRGGMGVVYEAEQESLGRRVALKILARPVTDEGGDRSLNRFRREARAVAKLHHTNIVPVFDVGQDGSTFFYAMQYIRGQPLDSVIGELRRQWFRAAGAPDAAAHPDDGTVDAVARSLVSGEFSRNDALRTASMPIREAGFDVTGDPPAGVVRDVRLYFRSVARLARQVAEGLAHAHGRGVLHRDVKPSNLLLDSSGVVWITDFGMAKVGDESLTHTGDIVGTLRYMAPERFKGQCDARADIYALGLTLYELLVFRPVFRSADRLMLVQEISESTPPSPRSLDPRIPIDLDTIVLKAIDKDPDRRYPSAEEMADDLARFIDSRPILARRIGSLERLARWTHRNPLVAGLSISLAVLLLAAAVASTIAAYRFRGLAEEERAATKRALLAEQLATRNLEHARSSAAQAALRAEALRRQDYISRVHLAFLERGNDNVARALELLEGCPEDLRGWEWEFVQRRCQVSLRSWKEAGQSVNALAFSPREDRLAIGTGNFLSRRRASGHLTVRDARSGELVFERRDLPGGVSALAFDPSGTRLASGNGSTVTVWDLTQRAAVFTRDEGTLDVLAVAFDPTGKVVAAGYGAFNRSSAGYARLWDATTGREVGERIPGRAGGVWSLAFHPGGRKVALTSEGLTEIWNLETRETVARLTAHEGFLYSVAFHPEGHQIATGGLDRSIRLWDARSGKLMRRLVGHKGFVRSLAYSPDGRQLISASEDKTVRLWDLESEREATVFREHMHFVNCVSFGRDGGVFASGGLDRTVRLWFADANHQLIYRGHLDQGHPHALDFDPVGGAIASGALYFAGDNDRLHLWDSRTGAPRIRFAKNVGEVSALSFRYDGKRIAASHPDGIVTIWDTATGRLLRRLQGHVGRVQDVVYSPDGSLIASAGIDSGVNLWNAESGRLMRTAVGHEATVHAVAFSGDAEFLATASEDGTARLWETDTCRELHTFSEHRGEVRAIAFSPDGRSIASAGGIDHRLGEVLLWDRETGELVRRLRGHTDIVYDVAYSPDGLRLATGSDDRTVKLWNPETGEEMFSLRGHTAGVVSVAFSPDGRQIASGSVDRSVRVWSLDAASAEVRYARAGVTVAEAGHALYEEGRWRAALRELEAASRLGIDERELRIHRAVAEIQDAPSEEARRQVAARHSSSMADTPGLTGLAMELVRLGRPRLAATAIERVTALAPNDAAGHAAAGRIHALVGESDRARRDFARSIEILAHGATARASSWWETGWWVTGPFADRLRDSTLSVDEVAPYTPGAASRTPVSNEMSPPPVVWRTLEKDGDGYLDFGRLPDGASSVSAYALEYVYTPRERTVAVVVGSADTMRLWRDNELVYEQRRAGSLRFDEGVVAVELRPGWTRLVAKVASTTGEHGMYVELSDRSADLARAYAARRRLDEVKAVWDQASEEERDDPELLEVVGNALARRGEWQEAAVIYGHLTERQPVRNLNWVTVAPLLLETGDVAGYRWNCHELTTRFGHTDNPLTLDRTGKACLLMPDTPANFRLPAQLTARAATIGAGHRFAHFFLLAKGMGEYRVGESVQACRTLEVALERNADRDPYLAATACVFLAMSYHARESEERAWQFMRRAEEIIAKRLPKRDSGDLGPAWLDWLICDLAHREAERVLTR